MKNENRIVLSCFLCPKKDTELAKLEKINISQFNSTTFEPKEEDFIYARFRLLSAHIVGADSWQATDFSNEQVLKKSIPLLEGKPAYINHSTYSIENSIGTIVNLKWVEKSKDEQGNEIPAGIEGDYRIDAVSNNKIARSVLNGEIQGSSVTIAFTWTPSHVFEEDYMFEWRCGETINGEMVRRIVDEVVDYYESSLVFRPADPYARPVSPKNTAVSSDSVRRLNDENEEVKKKYSDNKTFELFDNPIQNKTKMQFSEGKDLFEENKKQISLLTAQREDIEKKLNEQKEINVAQQKVMQSAELENTTLSNKIIELENQIEKSKKLVSFGEKAIQHYRDETKRLYQLSTENPLDSFMKLIDEASQEQLEVIAQTYNVKAIGQFTPNCIVCNGKNISFQTSQNKNTTEENNQNKDKDKEPKTLLDAFKNT
jgi:hypothetical protein